MFYTNIFFYGFEQNYTFFDKSPRPEIKKKYIFYPAMYLPHKNHKYIIDVIKILNNELNIEMSAVFCGSDKGYLNKIKNYSKETGQQENSFFLDFVEDKYLP